MYVCLCNGINDLQIRTLCATLPSCTVAQVYKAQGVAPKCGKCIPTVRALIAETREAAENAAPALGLASA
jgi:bacterioferritin-associated ferredoxin